MKRRWFQVTAFGCGVIFAIGLGLSGMGRPSKVLGFLDVLGDWDPALLFVMAAAVSVHFAFARGARKLARPVLDTRFVLASRQTIDKPLLVGAAVFGIGWGLQGYCPGPAVVALASFSVTPVVFLAALFVGQRLVASSSGASAEPRLDDCGRPQPRSATLQHSTH